MQMSKTSKTNKETYDHMNYNTAKLIVGSDLGHASKMPTKTTAVWGIPRQRQSPRQRLRQRANGETTAKPNTTTEKKNMEGRLASRACRQAGRLASKPAGWLAVRLGLPASRPAGRAAGRPARPPASWRQPGNLSEMALAVFAPIESMYPW